MITAQAPGKLLLLGEYAVLEGAPALVVAVDRLARVRVASAERFEISAPQVGIDGLEFAPGEGNGLPPVVAAVIEAISAEEQLEPLRITIDTAAFFIGADKLLDT